MITEDYVSFEIAKLLKEKGFDGECSRFYMPNGHGRWKYEHYHDFDISDRIECPTLQMAMKWLMEEHNLVITTYATVDGWRSGVSRIKFNGEGFILNVIDGIDGGNIPTCDTYEEVCEAAIRYCLQNLI